MRAALDSIFSTTATGTVTNVLILITHHPLMILSTVNTRHDNRIRIGLTKLTFRVFPQIQRVTVSTSPFERGQIGMFWLFLVHLSLSYVLVS
jgi:hypothetical protein